MTDTAHLKSIDDKTILIVAGNEAVLILISLVFHRKLFMYITTKKTLGVASLFYYLLTRVHPSIVKLIKASTGEVITSASPDKLKCIT